MALTNSTVRRQQRPHQAGGIRALRRRNLTLTNTTVSSNVASHAVFNDIGVFGYGGGINSGDTVALTNSTVSGNSAEHRWRRYLTPPAAAHRR